MNKLFSKSGIGLAWMLSLMLVLAYFAVTEVVLYKPASEAICCAILAVPWTITLIAVAQSGN
ncbi:MAG TPA: hypothetical protein DCR55_03885 [Lentisphaeria bacterium]|nr:hypothetical protein [Lentisphaeria bacterium]